MFPHSKIANIPTNTKAVALKPPILLTGSVPKHLNDDLKKELSPTQWYKLPTDGNSDVDGNFFQDFGEEYWKGFWID